MFFLNNNKQILIKTKFLKNYKINNIDNNIFQKILSISKLPNVKAEKFITPIITFLNCYYSIQNKNLSYIDLSSKETNIQFSRFMSFLNPQYIDLNENSLIRCKSGFIKIIKHLSNEHNNLKDIKEKPLDINKFDQNKINYYQGYHLVDPRTNKSYFFNIIDLYPIFNFKEMDEMVCKADIFISLHGGALLKSSLPILKSFNIFIKDNVKDKNQLLEGDYASSIIKEFCRKYFKEGQDKNYCLNSRMRYWNYFKKLFDFVFYQTGLINLPHQEYPIAPTKDKKSFLTNIKQNNGIQYKKKLITEIPLNLSDNEAIEILFSQILSDIKNVKDWYSINLNLFEKNVKKPLIVFSESDFTLNSEKFKKKHKINLDLNELIFKSGIPTHSVLEYFMFGLIDNHPEITDSFLIKFELYDLKGRLVGIKKTDAGMYLTGNKLRRGSKLAEQNILLNKESEKIINLLLTSTSLIRNYLKKIGNNDWCKLFIGLNEGLMPKSKNKTIIPAPSNMGLMALQDRIMYFENKKDIKDPLNFVSNLTLTKFRASKGVETYLKTESTNEMSKVLGHDKYRPELLSRYLPEVILNFFQTRWIRIFQKGIICEALKDSDYLYKASNFTNMKELDSFIKKNSIIQKEKDLNKDVKENKNTEEIFISINEDILTSLLSIEKAVEESNCILNPKAIYWSEFSKRLRNEIKNENKNISFLPILKEAEKKIDSKLFKEVINA